MTTATLTVNAIDAPGAGAGALGMTTGTVRSWLRIEGLAAFAAALVLYGSLQGNWWLLVPLLLLPDISAAGYLAGPRAGAFAYNLFHTWATGLAVLGLGAILALPAIQLLGVVLLAHVGMDRAAGYGLKLSTSFGETHLGRIGRRR